ncbi:MAG: D-alanyl-D-alanine carboxypeptidase [Pelagibacterales bacterium]|nr:D-alanyl-D-alanine carboxypeptidase [Pelagibacterales bacterium]
MKKLFLPIILFFLFVNINISYSSFIDTEAETAIIIDGDTGQILFEKNKDIKTYPASMTKIMTVLIIFEKLKNGTLQLDDKFTVSERAWKEREGSSMFVEVGKEIRVEDLLRGIIIQSGNDACIVVAEEIAGSEEAFAIIMNDLAKDIGLMNTNFTNSTGMFHEDNYSTVHDIALLSRYLINNFKNYYHIFAETEFEWSGIKQNNRNPLLYKEMGADGLKTGHLSASGYGLAASAVQDGRRLISVTNGFSSSKKRSQGSARLLTWGFREFTNINIGQVGEVFSEIEIPLAKKMAQVMPSQNMKVTVSKANKDKIIQNIKVLPNISAPLPAGSAVATLEVILSDAEKVIFDLETVNEVEKTGIIGRFFSFVINLITSLFSIIFS